MPAPATAVPAPATAVPPPVRPVTREEGAVTAADLLARAGACSQVSRGRYRTDADSRATVRVCGTRDAVFWKGRSGHRLRRPALRPLQPPHRPRSSPTPPRSSSPTAAT
ncbi:hypothetical protein [Streptomyces echinatus]|uniref:hypothetical protein n=1 Tax=Streptomyces echinatus TaxID=67293 RepID=UPI003CD062A4